MGRSICNEKHGNMGVCVGGREECQKPARIQTSNKKRYRVGRQRTKGTGKIKALKGRALREEVMATRLQRSRIKI